MEPLDAVHRIVDLAEDRKAANVVVLDVTGLTVVTDFYVIVSARNPIQGRAIVDSVAEGMAELRMPPRHQEGYREGRWILQDYGDIVLHCFLPDVRRTFDLERLWGDAVPVSLA